ncbi:MAG TPA: delta-60 repeat domain-containing protein [Casimicrobium sp.]|nr:delta-60 repeat domain-containing protein [Casimicrobium sp.]
MKSQTQYLVTEPTARTHQAPRAVSQLRRRLAAVVCCAVAAFAHAQDPIPGSLHTTPFPGFASGNGKITNLAIGASDDFGQAVALQPDGKIVLAGYCYNGSNKNFCIARLNADGTLDASFDGPSGSGNGKFLLPIGTSDDYASAIALQPDGKIVLAGHCFSASNEDFCVARLNADGSLDTSFDGPSGGGNGKFLFLIGGGTDQATAVALQPDGKIVLAGACTNGIDNDFCVARLNATGTLDASFDGPSGSGNGKFLLPIGASGDQATAVALQPDGKIVLAGGCLNGSNYDFCVARLNADGSLDSSFDGPSGSGNGKFLLPIGTDYDYANAVALQPDGKIVLAGTCGNFIDSYFCVARLNGGPFGAKQCSPDYDGDGKVLATTDILMIGARVALGLTGNAVVGGITFAAHAARTTWPDIRTFLVSQCGMTIAP